MLRVHRDLDAVDAGAVGLEGADFVREGGAADVGAARGDGDVAAAGGVGVVFYGAVGEDADAEDEESVEAGGFEGGGVGFEDVFEEVEGADGGRGEG